MPLASRRLAHSRSRRRPRPLPRSAGSTQICVMWPVSERTRAEDQSGDGRSAWGAEDERVDGVKDAAAGKANDVVQKSLRAMQRAVLIVELRVHVAGVAAMDERGGGVVKLRLPALDGRGLFPHLRSEMWGTRVFGNPSGMRGSFAFGSRMTAKNRGVEFAEHEEAREAAEAGA
jgi:hypothetical protein